ncbi:hypothetical protein AS859_09680, partial [Aliarcobacter cryaerophilus]
MLNSNIYNVLVTGSSGQVGNEIKAISSDYSYNFFFTDRNNIDITSKDSIKEFCKTNNINVIINCAAYTAVDKAQSDEINADLINRKAVKKLALVSQELNIKLIHISTDYVFDGKNFKPYCEEFQTNPQSIYGKTKLDGVFGRARARAGHALALAQQAFGRNIYQKNKKYMSICFLI